MLVISELWQNRLIDRTKKFRFIRWGRIWHFTSPPESAASSLPQSIRRPDGELMGKLG